MDPVRVRKALLHRAGGQGTRLEWRRQVGRDLGYAVALNPMILPEQSVGAATNVIS